MIVGAFMKHITLDIAGIVSSTSAVTVKEGELKTMTAHFQDKLMKPNNFNCNISKSMIFDFGRRVRDNRLLLAFSGD